MARHGRDGFFVVGEGVPTADPAAETTALSEAITAVAPDHEGEISAGFTYLGQFVADDPTMDKTQAALGSDVTVDELIQGADIVAFRRVMDEWGWGLHPWRRRRTSADAAPANRDHVATALGYHRRENRWLHSPFRPGATAATRRRCSGEPFASDS